MKKQFFKIFYLILSFICIFQNYCNADSIIDKAPLGHLKNHIIFYAIIGCIIFFISATSYLIIKKNTQKRIDSSPTEQNFKKLKTKLMIISIFFFVIVTSFFEMSSSHSYGLPNTIWADILDFVIFFVPFICFTISIFSIFKEKWKQSFIAFGIGFVIAILYIVCSITINKIYDANVEKYNTQFSTYIENIDEYWTSTQYVNDIQGLITTTMNNNINKRKTTIEYNNTSYTSPAELEVLLNNIDTDMIYITQDLYGNDYIDYITLIPCIDKYVEHINNYKNNYSISVKDFIIYVKNLTIEEPYNSLDVTIIYATSQGQEITLRLNQVDEDYDLPTDYLNNFDESKKYNIDVQSILPNIVNIYITE